MDFFSFWSPAWAGIEIYADGHKYDSFAAYQESKKPVLAQKPPQSASLNNQQEEYIRKEAKRLGINVDFSKIKTFQAVSPKLSPTTMHKLYVMSVENGVVHALEDFYRTRGEAGILVSHSVSSAQLQKAIQQAVTVSQGPKLLISQPGKLRIMTLNAKEAGK